MSKKETSPPTAQPFGLEGHDWVAHSINAKEKSPMGTNTTIGLDLAKLVFSACEQDAFGRVCQRKDLRRSALLPWLAQLPAGTPFRKSKTSKNDRNDAEAIATAARRGNMRFVPIKSEHQQTRLAWHRVREGYKADALATSNRLRGLLAEFGVVMARSEPALLRALGDDVIRAGLPPVLLGLLDQHAAHWRQLRECLAECDRHIATQAKADQRCVRVQQLTGVGALTADAMV